MRLKSLLSQGRRQSTLQQEQDNYAEMDLNDHNGLKFLNIGA